MKVQLYNCEDLTISLNDAQVKYEKLEKAFDGLKLKNVELNDALSDARNGAVMSKVQTDKAVDKELELKDKQISKLQNKQKEMEESAKTSKQNFEVQLKFETDQLAKAQEHIKRLEWSYEDCRARLLQSDSVDVNNNEIENEKDARIKELEKVLKQFVNGQRKLIEHGEKFLSNDKK